jgi:hypothetical protein
MTPTYCLECGRANGAASKKCIWCGVPLVDRGAPDRFETTRVEIDYLDGIERLDNPAPVRLVISSEGLEISELMPGSRTFKISAEAIVAATVIDASTTIEGKKVRPRWLWFALGPFAAAVPARQMPDEKKHEYILNIKYRVDEDERNAVFQRADRLGLHALEGLAKIIRVLIKVKSKK